MGWGRRAPALNCTELGIQAIAGLALAPLTLERLALRLREGLGAGIGSLLWRVRLGSAVLAAAGCGSQVTGW